MELKVWVEGIQRVVCGVTETTTCQDVVYALAHATGKTGRFTLIEKWRNSERLLAPSEFPRKILIKWGEYSNDVQFILQRTALEPKPTLNYAKDINSHGSNSSSSGSPKTSIQSGSPKHGVQSAIVNKDIKKSLTFSGVHAAQCLIPQQNESFGENCSKSPNNGELFAKTVKLDRIVPGEASPAEKFEDSNKLNGYPEARDTKLAGDINDNVLTTQSVASNRSKQNGQEDGCKIKELFQQLATQDVKEPHKNFDCRVEKVVVDSYYKSLVKLVNMQREKLNAQQVDLTKHEAEIAYLDGRWKENESRLKYLQSEIQQIEQKNQFDHDSEKVAKLEKELESAQNSEISMKKLLSELKEKYTACMNSIAHVSFKASSLEKQLNAELETQKKYIEIENEEEELAILREIEKLQMAVLQANQQVQSNEDISNLLSNEISELEMILDVKRSDIDILRQSMKEANLEALIMTPPEDTKQSPEGSWKSGTSRVMKGSPRQLETAVPTSKNPHGVWV